MCFWLKVLDKTISIRRYFLPLIYSSMKKITLIGIFSVLFFAWCTQQTPTKNLDAFAQCLTDNWAIMYGSPTCSHCLDQKAMFGDSFQKINYVDCTKEFDRCTNLKWTPTWEFKDWSQIEWSQELSVLAKKTNCTLP